MLADMRSNHEASSLLWLNQLQQSAIEIAQTHHSVQHSIWNIGTNILGTEFVVEKGKRPALYLCVPKVSKGAGDGMCEVDGRVIWDLDERIALENGRT